MSVGFGLLGSGFMAHTYAQSLAKHVPDGHLVAVAEGSRAPALADEYGVPALADTAAVLARDDVDAVLICTPHSTHRALTEAAAGSLELDLEAVQTDGVAGEVGVRSAS